MPHLIDTDIMVDLTRNNQAAIEYMEGLEGQWSISAITSLELIAGARNQRETSEIDLLLSAYPAIPPTEEITRRGILSYEDVCARARTANFRFADCRDGPGRGLYAGV